MSYFVFVDNFNVWIEGKVASAVLKGWAKNTAEAHRLKLEDKAWRIDFGKLLQCVTNYNIADIKKAVLFGSKPPHNDSLWNAMSKAQFEVIALDRNIAGKEKAIDTGIIAKITKSLYKDASIGDTFVLVMGDKDFIPAIDAIRDEHCRSVVAFWDNASAELISEADVFLDLTQSLQNISH